MNEQKHVLFLSNNCDPENVVTGGRREKEVIHFLIPKWSVNTMSIWALYKYAQIELPVSKESQRYYMRMIWPVLDVMIVNTCIMFGFGNKGKTMDLKEFTHIY